MKREFPSAETGNLAEATRTSGELRRALSVGTATAIVIANMVGSGIYTTAGFIAREVGNPWVMLGLWVVGGIVALCGALCFAELGAAMPQAGGEYIFLREAYGQMIAFLSGWMSIFIGFSGALAAVTLTFVSYIHRFFPALTAGGMSGKLVALCVLWILATAHLVGLGPGSVVQRALAAATVCALVVLVGAGFVFGRGSASHFFSAAPPHGNAAVALIYVQYAYAGWGAAAYVAGEIRDPAYTLPRALLSGTSIVTALYLAINALYLYALPPAALANVMAVAERSAAALFSPHAADLVSLVIALSVLDTASGMVMAAPRICYAMGRDGLVPLKADTVHPRLGTPARAILLTASWASVLILFFSAFQRLLVYVGFVVTVFSALAVGAVIVLRYRNPELARPFRVPLFPVLPGIYLAVSFWIAVYVLLERPREALLGILTVVAGLPFYWFQRRRKST